MTLEMKARRSGDVAVLHCTGRIVYGDETADLRSQVKELLSHTPRIVLELGNVRDIDSGGVGTLVGLYTSAVAAGGSLKLACAGKKVLQTLSITHLLGILRVYDREEDAVAAFSLEQERTRAVS